MKPLICNPDMKITLTVTPENMEKCNHKFKNKAPKLPIRLKGEREYKRHNFCSKCKRVVAIE
ncbi:MAG: hypothetical protein ACYSSI_00120 [Planctomycetota bacterium]